MVVMMFKGKARSVEGLHVWQVMAYITACYDDMTRHDMT